MKRKKHRIIVEVSTMKPIGIGKVKDLIIDMLDDCSPRPKYEFEVRNSNEVTKIFVKDGDRVLAAEVRWKVDAVLKARAAP